MMRRAMIAPMLLLMGATAAPPPPLPVPGWCGGDVPTADAADAPTILLPGYGKGGFPIQTKNPEAQAFFDNGMQLAHAFAHKAAIAAFQQARKLDPDCAMCAWGEAWASGPTLNYGIGKEAAKKLAEIVATAEKLAANGPVRERNLIGALKQRYPASGGTDNKAFAAAMEQMAALAPGDDEMLTITADALMVASDYKPESMQRPIALLETVLKRDPAFAPAIHFYIHATEIAGTPALAEHYADSLATLAPAASHLVHMPSHTYYRIGRYADAGTANVRAVEVTLSEAGKAGITEPQQVWAIAYHAHNVSFGLAGALISDDARSALFLARPLIAATPKLGERTQSQQFMLGKAYVALARFAEPEEMLAIAQPAGPAAQLMWHYSRGEALARKGDVAGVRAEAAAIAQPKSTKDTKDAVATVARLVLEGRAAALDGKLADAASAFERAAAIEEAAPLADYWDPPLWWYPVRRDLAAVLLAKGDAKGALAAADGALKHRARDPISLALRAKAQEKLGNNAAAQRDMKTALAGWRGTRARLG